MGRRRSSTGANRQQEAERESSSPARQAQNNTGADRVMARPQRSVHWLDDEVDLSKHNAGLKLIPAFTGQNWDEFKRKIETQFVIMGLDSFLLHPPTLGNPMEYRNDKLATAQISMRLPQAQYKQISRCLTTSEIWSTLTAIYEQTAESKASSLFLKFIHYQKKSNQSMKTYLDDIVELYHDMRVYSIDIGELALCVKALDGLPDQIQASQGSSSSISS